MQETRPDPMTCPMSTTNNPLNYIDPFGLINHKGKDKGQGIGAGRLWLTIGLEVVTGTVIGIGIVALSPLWVAIGVVGGVAIIGYEGYEAYKEGKEIIEDYNERLEKAKCNRQ